MTTRVYCMYGLGGALWSYGIENVLARAIRKLPDTYVPATRGYTQWREIVDDIKRNKRPGDKIVVIGHSMGAASATYVTDYVQVDLVVLYDLAGQAPSKLGKNTGRAIDIYDTAPDMVPEWRVQAVKGHEQKIERWTSAFGHTGQDDSIQLASKVVEEVKKLAA